MSLPLTNLLVPRSKPTGAAVRRGPASSGTSLCNSSIIRSFCRPFAAEGGCLDAFLLDSGHFLRYSSSNTPAPPLPLVGEAHLGQVFLCADGNLYSAAMEGTP